MARARFGTSTKLAGQCGYQCKRQVTVSDRLAVRHFTRRALGIDVYPLMVGGRLGKLVDTILVNDGPVRHADFRTFEQFGVFD